MQLPTLYKPTKTGATQVCSISSVSDSFTVTYGQLDGKMQTQTTTCKPKNIGKSNETTAEQQALLEAQAKWDKKVKAGYSTDQSAPVTVQLPMKVKVYQDHKDSIKFPCISTFKLNGVNGTYRLEDGTLNLYSRGGELYPEIPHLTPQIIDAMEQLGHNELNGELYIPGAFLEDITSAVKKPKDLSTQLEFHIFDICDSTDKFSSRINQLYLLDDMVLSNVFCIPTFPCETHTDIEVHYSLSQSLGLEGTVIKHLDGLYQHNVHSSDQFKYKKTKDAEFKVTNFTLDKHGHPVYTCQSKGGKFKVKRKGTAEQQLADAAIASSNIGKWLTVEYETMSKYDKPLKPVGLDFRNCDTNGNPLD